MAQVLKEEVRNRILEAAEKVFYKKDYRGAKLTEIAKKYNALSVKYEELEHLKVNMNEYLGRDKREKKESVIEKISRHKEQDKKISKEKKEKMKEVER